jgi:hypothetical protein
MHHFFIVEKGSAVGKVSQHDVEHVLLPFLLSVQGNHKPSVQEVNSLEVKYLETSHVFFDTLSADDARELSRISLLRRKETLYYVIECNLITVPAQQALLKTFEEPQGNIVFILLIPRAEMLLSTVKSRAHIIKANSIKNFLIPNIQTDISDKKRVSVKDKRKIATKHELAVEFLNNSMHERLTSVGELITLWQKDEDISLREHAARFITAVQAVYLESVHKSLAVPLPHISNLEVAQKSVDTPNEKKNQSQQSQIFTEDCTQTYESLLKIIDYINDPSCSVKMLLERLANLSFRD